MADGLDLKRSRPFDLILKHHRGMTHRVAPRWIEKKEAPVKEIVQRGAAVNLAVLRRYFATATGMRGRAGRRPCGRCVIRMEDTISPGTVVSTLDERETIDFILAGTYGTIPKAFEAQRADAGGSDRGRSNIPSFRWVAGRRLIWMWTEYAAVGGIYREATRRRAAVTASELWGKELVVLADAEVF